MDEIRVDSRKSIDSLSVGSYRQGVASPAESRTKRVLDFVASIIGMVVFSPLFLIIYIAIKREDGGNAIFKQERVGYRGKIFTLYKFRSMAVTSESDGKPVLCSGKDDKRLTRVGRFCVNTIWTNCRSYGTCARGR